ncbi:DUF305 domain-containing protein [Rhodobacter sp. NSM]|uniref:DUF305 domain-containing protein n=1 Tax=Rhodobacter sp. NSM TaxID=3457501 RepID=UPI003FD6272A
MSYIRFGLMILTSTLVMFGLMYLNTYSLKHVFFSETRVYMALMMGATMAIIMLGYMLGMYRNRALNAAIFVTAVIGFALSLWLVRSQVTVSGTSYMEAMIPHHSIAIMTSERADIKDPRVRKLADEIAAAQRREIAEMRYLVAEVSAGRTVDSVYIDPPAHVGDLDEALSTPLIAELDPSPIARIEAEEVVTGTQRCTFRRGEGSDPILWASAGGAVMKLNGVLVPLEPDGSMEGMAFTAPGVLMRVRQLGEEGGWRSDAELLFALDRGLEVGYRGSWRCGA